MIYRTKWHEKLITCMGKHRPLMYNENVKKLIYIYIYIVHVVWIYFNYKQNWVGYKKIRKGKQAQ